MSYTRLFDIIRYQKEKFSQTDALNEKVEGQWINYSTDEVVDYANRVSSALIASDFKPGEKVAIISNNRPQWNFVDLGVLQVGGIDVPIYPTISADDFAYIFNDAQVKICFVSDKELLGKVNAIKDKVPTLKEVFIFNKDEGGIHWSEFLQRADAKYNDDLEARRSAVKPEELATLIYTSGTTGQPKGVMLSHNNIIANLKSTLACLPLEKTHRTLSFLPLCHIFERMVTYTYQAAGASIYYAESMETIGDNLKEVKPHFFSTVPRLLEKVYEKIMAKGYALTGIKKKLFFWAIKVGQDYKLEGRSGGYDFKLKIANKLIFSKWREALGGNVQGIVTGAAALQERLGRIFTAAQLPVREGYGLTETSPVISFNRFEDGGVMFGSVGLPIPGVEVKLDPVSGEILARGPNVMMGYYNKPEETAKVIDADGWFHTGDKGELVNGKFIKIIDRIKELYKTSGGKYVAPQPLENKFKESNLIEQIMVVGNNQKFVSALIVPAWDALIDYCKNNALPHQSKDIIAKNPQVVDLYMDLIGKYNPSFSNTEQIKKFKLLPNEWGVKGGELTPTLKLKRAVIREKYAKEIEEIYAG